MQPQVVRRSASFKKKVRILS